MKLPMEEISSVKECSQVDEFQIMMKILMSKNRITLINKAILVIYKLASLALFGKNSSEYSF